MTTIKEKYESTCQRAAELSKDGRIRHVCTVISFGEDRVPGISGFNISDWMDDSTVKSYSNGHEIM